MPALSLRLVISVTSAVLVTIVAAVTLAVLLTTTTASLRDVGRSHAAGMIDTVKHRTVALFEPSFITLDLMTNFTSSRRWPWPSDDRATFDAFFVRGDAMYQMRELKAPGVLMYFWDNTRISIDPFNATTYRRATVQPSSLTAAGSLEAQRIFTNTTYVDHTRNFHVSLGNYRIDEEEDRTRGTSLETLLLTLTASGRQATIAGIFDRSDRRGLTESYVTFLAPLFRLGDARTSDNLYGFVVTSLHVEDMNYFLSESRATPNTEAFAADAAGYLYGSSILDRSIRSVSDVPTGARTTQQGCTTTDSLGGISDGPNKLVCRASHKTYGHAPLAALERDDFRRDGQHVALRQLSGDTYFVATVRVPMRLPGMPIQLVLLMPEADVIGDVVKSRNVAIGIVAALVVVAAAVNFAVIFVLLAPLEAIAGRMRKAANLEDDGEEDGVSAMAEVAALQEAYYEMNEELNRIRSFVPQSVLMAKQQERAESTALENDDEGDLDDTVTQSARSPARSAMSQSINSRNRSGGGRSPASRRSTASRHSAVFAELSGAATRLSMKPRNVTILVANTCGFARSLARDAGVAAVADSAIAKSTELVDFVSTTIGNNGGVISLFQGDHFVATFNAVKPNAGHATAAARTGAALRDGCAGVGFGATLRIGIATGKCHVGNLGNKEVKAFSTVGPAYQQACVLERLNRMYSPSNDRSMVLTTRRTCADIATAFLFRFVDIVALPGSAKPTLIATVLEPYPEATAGDKKKDGNDDEWLYVVGGNDRDDVNATWNEAFVKLLSDEVDAAQTLMQEHLKRLADEQSKSASESAASDVDSARFKQLADAPRLERTAVLGAYYNTVYRS